MTFPTGQLRALVLALLLGAQSPAAQSSALQSSAAPSSAAQATSGPASNAQEHGADAPARHVIAITSQDGKDGPRWSVLCENTPLEELMRALCKKVGCGLEGSELLAASQPVTVDLRRRPLEQVLEFVLGSQGLASELARGTLRLAPVSHDQEELLRRAQEAWRTVEAGGDEEAVAHAKLAQGNLAEVRDDLESAYQIYAELGEDEHALDAAEATFRAGRMLEKLGHWAEAAQHFRTLASRDDARPFHAKARLELARVSIELGDPQSSLHLLNFLEANYPSDDALEQAERCLVRAQACDANKEYVEALRTLEEGEFDAAPAAEARSLEIRATAFEGLGYHVEAARAWLLYAREAPSEERPAAFERAANLSLEAGDELGALFVCREAAKAGADEGMGSIAHSARARLGLDEDEAPTTIQERLELAEKLLSDKDNRKANELFEGLYLARGALPELDQARVLAGWSRIVLARSGLDAAIELLARTRASFEDPEAARQIDLAAAALFEDEGRYDDAAEAYRGNY